MRSVSSSDSDSYFSMRFTSVPMLSIIPDLHLFGKRWFRDLFIGAGLWP